MKMNFKIGEVLPNTPHLYSDLAELIAVINYTGRNDLHKNDLLSLSSQSSTSVDEAEQEDRELREEASDAERNDRLERQIEDVWTHLEFRQSFLGDSYPFEVEGDFIRMKDELTDIQRIYILLLVCSRLRSFKSVTGLIQRWAKYFTNVSKFALKSLLPTYADVKIFDANSEDRREYYGTDLRQALRILGRDLGMPSIIETECDRAGSSGDAGFDLIATIKFDDGISSNYGILGQCGAQEREWPRKNLEAHGIKLRTFYQIHFEHPSAMFTPVLYRDSLGHWVDTAPCAGVIVLDRVRILELLLKGDYPEIITRKDWFAEFEDRLGEFELV
ncbi:hypothetical protein [Pectobacterium polaris]|uniref:hypothetical protein n=1 Tax=Pectobacterium polaris TaxID=2042057 RepID=UPI0032E519C2